MGARGPKSFLEQQTIARNRAQIAANRVVIDHDLPQPPSHLSADMKRFFSGIIADHEDLEPDRLHVLRACCEAWDRSQQAREALAKHGTTYTDSKGMIRSRPEISIERDSRVAFLRALRELKLEVAPPTGGNSWRD